MSNARPKALLCDDRASIRRVFSGVLHRLGYDVTLGTCGDDALRAIRGETELDPSELKLIVLDNDMRPGPYGIDVLKTARVLLPNVAIVLHTADEGRYLAREAAANKGYRLSKTGSLAEFERGVGLALELVAPAGAA